MKRFLLFALFILLCKNLAEAQTSTFADPPGPEHVLVVYNTQSDTSGYVKDYYLDKRNIPAYNVVHLENLIDDDIYDSVSNTTHRIILDQQGEIIRDSINQNSLTPSIHAWLYFNDRIAIPIANYLKDTYVNGTPLKDIIRFIVLVKGVPFRIDARKEDSESYGTNVICANLLTHLGETMEDEDALLFYYNKTPGISNPYYNVDDNFSMEHRFLPNHYQTVWQGRTIKLSYLVTHLSAPRFEDIQGMIDRSLNAINETNYDWFIDAKEAGALKTDANNTEEIFNSLGINNYFFETTSANIIDHEKPIMTYSSDGTWAGFQPDYIQSQLIFDYADGAFFSSWESHNGLSIGTFPVIRTRDQGLLADFTLMGGTVGVGQAFHSTGSHVIRNFIFFPGYAVGYTFIEAAYLGLSHLDATNVVVGDPLTIIFSCQETIISTNTTIGSGEYNCNLIVEENATLTIDANSIVSFSSNAKLLIYGTLEVQNGANIILNHYSNMQIHDSGEVTMNSNSSFTFNDKAKLISNANVEIFANRNFIFNDKSEFHCNEIVKINPGSIITFNNDSKLIINGSLISLGSSSSKVIFNFSNITQYQFLFQSGERLEIDNTIFNSNGLSIKADQSNLPPEFISITNSTFSNHQKNPAIDMDLNGVNVTTPPLVENCLFNNCLIGALQLRRVPEITIKHNTAFLGSQGNGIMLKNNGKVDIVDFLFSDGIRGIITRTAFGDDEIIQDLFENINLTQCMFESIDVAIEVDGQSMLFDSVNVIGNHFNNCNIGILIGQCSTFTPVISNNTLSSTSQSVPISETGISIVNGNEVFISHNSIVNYQTGISLASVSQPYILNNTISALDLLNDPGPGIFSLSSNGQISKNYISGHLYGIELGKSSPNISKNYITANRENGIFIGDNSVPNLSQTVIDEESYPLTGYNWIYENGLCDFNLNAEINIIESYVELSGGCNVIADDRIDYTEICNFDLLIDGNRVLDVIYAEKNYWGNHPVFGNDPTGRFREDLDIVYDGYLNEPCESVEGESLFLLATNGFVLDTVYASGAIASPLTPIEQNYSTADKHYYENNFTMAKQIYLQIINDYGNERKSLRAYVRLFQVEKNLNAEIQNFDELRNFYSSRLPNLSDSIMIGILNHLMNQSLIAKQEYLSAINNFETLITNNPNTTLAFYTTIEALTTSLLLDSATTLGKVSSEHFAYGLDDYNKKVRSIINKRKDIESEDSEKIIPVSFNLYQNYPNPFNPITFIRYDIAQTENVELTIYNILGQRIRTLVNEIKQPGQYEVSFDASSLPSGIYVYRIKSENYLNSKKMLLIK